MSKFTILDKNKHEKFHERILLNNHGLTGYFTCYTGMQGNHWISYLPSINVSGYGDTMEESRESLNENLDIFCEDLFDLPIHQRILEIKKLGWENDKFFKKRYSKSYIDENGVLQGFDFPELVQKSLLKAA